MDWLAGYWLKHHDFGTLTDLIENDVREKLLEKNPKHLPALSAAKARKAAEVIAGIATLERKTAIRLPDGSLDPERFATALDPAHVLPDLSRTELVELLRLPLFDEATYGRVRIHHRSVTEYLAAQWLETLLSAGLATKELESLVFRHGPEGPLVPAEVAPVAAWLAGDHAWLRDRLIDVAPTVLLQGGDPNRLPDESRRALLASLARRYVGRKRLYKLFDHMMLGRLASAGIVDIVNDLLRASTQDEFLDTLLLIISEGRLSGCVDETLRLATSAAASPFVRSEAVRALAAIGSEQHIEELLACVVDRAPEIDHGVAGALIERLYPSWMSTDRVIRLMTKAHGPAPQHSSLLTYYLGQKVLRDTPETDRARLLKATLDLVRVEGEPKKAWKSWLLGPLAHMVTDLDSNLGPIGLEPILPVLRFFASLAYHGHVELGLAHDRIRQLVAGNSELRRFLFWNDVTIVERSTKKRVRRYYDLPIPERLWQLTPADAGWLADDARARPVIHERLLAYDCLIVATPVVDGGVAEREQLLAELASNDPAIRKHLERYNRRATADYRELKWERAHRLQKAQEQKQHEENVTWLNTHLDGLVDGSEQYALVQLANQVDLDGEDPEAALTRLSKKYGDAVASATRTGWRRLWRQLRCKLPHEEEKRNTFDYSIIVGLSGLTLDIAGGLDLANLTPIEARGAVRYASRGMNHFPSWLEFLADAQPTAVTEIFAECIVADFTLGPDDPPPHAVLHLLSYATPIVRELCWRTVADLITRGEPSRLDILRDCVEVVVATSASHLVVATVVPARCRASRGVRYALWWSLWLVLDPIAALDEIEMAIGDNSIDADELMVTICDTVWQLAEDRRLSFPLPTEASALTRLVSVVFRHVRPDDDLEHIGAHVVGARDHAQSLRNYLLDQLAATPGEITHAGLRALAELPSLASSRDMLLALVEQRLTQDTGAREANVAERLVRAYRAHGLATIDHLKEAGLTATNVSPLPTSPATTPETHAATSTSDAAVRRGPEGMENPVMKNPDAREGTEFPATVVFVLIKGLKDCSDAPKVPNALRALNDALRDLDASVFVLSTIAGVIIVVPDTASWSIDVLLDALGQAKVGFALRVGVTHDTVEVVKDIDDERNLIGPPINIAARLATSADNPGVLLHESYVGFVDGILGAGHWLHRSVRTPIQITGKPQDPPFVCYLGRHAFEAKPLERQAPYSPRAAVLVAYDLPKFSAGDRAQLRKRFTRLAQVFQKLRQSASMQQATALLSPGGDGGVLVLDGVSLSDAAMIASRLQELSEIESLDHGEAIAVEIRIGVHYGQVMRYAC